MYENRIFQALDPKIWAPKPIPGQTRHLALSKVKQ